MSSTATVHPTGGHHLPHHLAAIALAAALVIAAIVTVIVLVAASRDSGPSRQDPVPTVAPAGSDFAQPDCRPARLAHAC